MKRFALAAALSLVCSSILITAQGNGSNNGKKPDDPVQVPDSSIEQPGDRGGRAHTNHVRVLRPGGNNGPSGFTPAQIVSAYGLTSDASGATIYIVDAYHYPTALSDFNTFASTFGLPRETSTNPTSASNQVFQVVYAAGQQPRINCGWAQEAALDIEWAHAMAPKAKIVLVEAASNSFADLLAAVDVALDDPLASQTSSSVQVSMSWGGSEFSSESSYDGHFSNAKNIVYTAASGDTGGKTIYPGVSPNVVSAGGTTLKADASLARGWKETGWSGSGGGTSAYESRPGYQDVLITIVGAKRGVPDWSFDADPQTGVSVYDSTSCQGAGGWLVFGGTSVASPSLAGIINRAGLHLNSQTELSQIYAAVSSGGAVNETNFFDIKSGAAGSFTAQAGWDFVTGIGSTNGVGGK